MYIEELLIAKTFLTYCVIHILLFGKAKYKHMFSHKHTSIHLQTMLRQVLPIFTYENMILYSNGFYYIFHLKLTVC